jgi:mevalonate kinase
MITISVPAKIHLLGEHAVVYGKPALLSAINLRVYVSIASSNTKYHHHKNHPQDENAHLLQQAIESSIKKKFGIKKFPHYKVELKSDIPIGFGLGSSASISAAYTAALLSFLKIDWDKNIVYDIAYEGEKVFHGNPSGGDLAAVIFGGFLWFRKEIESLKVIHSIPQRIHSNIGQFFLIDSGKPFESTKQMITKVKDFSQKNPPKVKRIFDNLEQLTKNLLIALVDGEKDNVINIIRSGEKNLENLGVVGKKTKAIIRSIESIGGACKIMGGGGYQQGSGMLLAYHANSKQLLQLLKQSNWKYEKVNLGEDGLRKEHE